MAGAAGSAAGADEQRAHGVVRVWRCGGRRLGGVSAGSVHGVVPIPCARLPQASSKFVLVPGPGDLGPGSSLPRPGLPRSVAAPLLDAVPNAVLASNPCR